MPSGVDSVRTRQGLSSSPCYRACRTSRYSSSLSHVSAAPDSIPDSSIPSRSSTVSKTEVVVNVVLPSCSSKLTVSTDTWPGMPSNSNVHTMRSGGTISLNSPWNPYSSPSGPRCTIRHLPPGRKSYSALMTSYFLGPHQCFMCSPELCASNTRSRGASKTRVIWISVSEGVVTVSLPLSPIVLLLSSALEVLQVLVQALVSLLPEAAVPFGPLGDVSERRGLQPGWPPLPLPAP